MPNHDMASELSPTSKEPFKRKTFTSSRTRWQKKSNMSLYKSCMKTHRLTGWIQVLNCWCEQQHMCLTWHKTLKGKQFFLTHHLPSNATACTNTHTPLWRCTDKGYNACRSERLTFLGVLITRLATESWLNVAANDTITIPSCISAL